MSTDEDEKARSQVKPAAEPQPSAPAWPRPSARPTSSGAPDKPATPEPQKPTSFVVAPGHTIHCRRGVLGDGDVVEARFVGGDEALAKLVAAGSVVPL